MAQIFNEIRMLINYPMKTDITTNYPSIVIDIAIRGLTKAASLGTKQKYERLFGKTPQSDVHLISNYTKTNAIAWGFHDENNSHIIL